MRLKINKAGWIKLYRQILLSQLWQDKPFARGQAWVDLLLLYDKNLDQLIISKRELGRRWGWSMSKVSKFIRELEENGDLKQKKKQAKSYFWLVKYRFFQEIAYQKETKFKTKIKQIPEAIKKDNKEKKEGGDGEGKRQKYGVGGGLWEFWERQ